MRKYLFALFSVLMLIGCQSGEDEAGDTSTENDAVTEETTEQTASSDEQTTEDEIADEDTEESTEETTEESTEEDASIEDSADTEETSSEETTESSLSSEQAPSKSEPEQVNVIATRCIISNLIDCDGVPLEDQKAAFQRLLDEGVFGKMEMSDTFLEEVQGAHLVMYNQTEHNTYPEDRYPPVSVDYAVKYYSMELENYYNGESEAVLGYLKEGSPLYQAVVENKDSGDFENYKLYDIELMPLEGSVGPGYRVVERVYSHASSNGIERERVSYDTPNNDTGPDGKTQLVDIESREVLEEDIEYEEEINEAYGPANTASPHARECVINFIRTCELDSIEDVRNAYDQYVANGTLPEAIEAESYPAKIDESRKQINEKVQTSGLMSTKNYENYFHHYAYDLKQFYNGKSEDVFHYIRPDSEAHHAIVSNKESEDYADHENYRVNVYNRQLNIKDDSPEEMMLELVYSNASTEGKHNNNVLYQFDHDDVSGIQIISFEEHYDEPFKE